MTDVELFPADIPRAKEAEVRDLAQRVAADGQRRALLLYGAGGVGKTRLVRNLARTGSADPDVTWLDPIDIDDPEYWLLPNLEREIARQLEPDAGQYFREYHDHLSRLPQYARPGVGHETVRSHLRRVDRTFADCYSNFVHTQKKAVVLVLDTVEAIRTSFLVLTLAQWMKQLPSTLFVLSCRPWPDDTGRPDPLIEELDDPHNPLPVDTLTLGGFEEEEAYQYLETSRLARALTTDEKQKIVHLTRGHPLWLALSIRYLATVGLPEEAMAHTVAEIRYDLPYGSEPTVAGRRLHEEYRRRLVTPYRSTEFWPEAIKRLAVIRQNVSEEMFGDLMSDRGLPPDVPSWEDAWLRLLGTAWVRPRANRQSVTLHDALAEELARRIILLHDRDETWRAELWQWADQTYARLIEQATGELERDAAHLDEVVRAGTSGQERTLAEQGARLDVRRHELDLLTTAHLYYRVLTDGKDGIRYFLELFLRADARGDLLFRELICLEMQQLLPDGRGVGRPYDLIDGPIKELHAWLLGEGAPQYFDIGLAISEYLVDNEQPKAAVALLQRLPWQSAGAERRYTAHLRMGNALLRVHNEVEKAALRAFKQALFEANSIPGGRRKAEALKELGFYHRNVGKWDEADKWYERAHVHIASVTPDDRGCDDLEELASIRTNWAYVSALRGRYDQAKELVDTAVAIRRQLGVAQPLGLSLSVRGEILRYEQSFEQAWDSYEESIAVFDLPQAGKWLGLLHQEQAICLFQAEQAGVVLMPGQREEAERLARSALDICRDHFFRHYPSALNRAGRIFADREPDRALSYLLEAADEARRLADAWFHVSSLIEYVELAFRTWLRTGDDRFQIAIIRPNATVDHLLSSEGYGFPGLRGRSDLLRAHIAILEGRQQSALDHYQRGLDLIARGSVAHGPGSIAHEFAAFRAHYERLGPVTRQQWRDTLQTQWSTPRRLRHTDHLLALLDDLA